MKKWISISALLLLTGKTFAESVAATTTEVAEKHSEKLVELKNFTFQDFLIVGTVICLFVLSFMIIRLLMILNLQVKRLALARSTNNPKAIIEEPGWWETFLKKFYGLKPLSMEGELIIEDHEYDGIVELKNGMPPWLRAFFIVTIVFAAAYWTYYMVLEAAPDQYGEYQAELDKATKEKEERNKMYANSMDENSVKLSVEPSDLNKGKNIFIDNCATCHKATAGGDSGPNLTDQFWMHGGGINNVFKTIKYGYIEKGMPGWSDKLNPQQIQQVASYVLSLQGSNPADGKDPQGELWKEEMAQPDSAVVKVDSLSGVKDTIK